MNLKRLISALGLSALLVAFIMIEFLTIAPHSIAQARPDVTHVGGVIAQSATWDLAGSPYIMDTSVIVTNGVTLTIEPGVMVQGTSHLVELRVLGTLSAIGTVTQPITVTSSDIGLAYNWRGLVVDSGTATLRHTTLEYACGEAPAGGSQYTSNILVINAGYLDLADSTVQHCDYGGGTAEMMVHISDGRASIHAATFSDSQWYPLDVAGANSVITLTDNIITGNGYNRIRIEADALLNADATLYPQAVWEGYEFAPGFNVPATRTLTLQSGVSVANTYNAELRVYGQLKALGTATHPITLTMASESAAWPGLLFDGAFAAGDLRYATVEHAGSDYGNLIAGQCDAIAVRDVLTHELHLENSRIQDFGGWCTDNGVYVENAHVAINSTRFNNLGDSSSDFAVRVKGASSVLTLTNNTISSTFANRILLEADALLGKDTTLVPQTGLQGYEFVTGFNVPATRTLTLTPGTTMLGRYNGELRVYGQLNAIGTLTHPITLTAADESDTNGWPGLLFDGAFAAGDLRYVNVQSASSNYGNASGMCNSLEARNVLTHEVHLADSQITDFGGWCDNSGLYAENSHVVVEDTVFTSKPNDAHQALRVTGNSTVLVERSQIESNSGRALLVEGDTAFVKVVNSTLIGNGVVGQVTGGVRNTGQANVILGGEVDAGNAIYSNQGYGAEQIHVAGHIVATYNWWGDPTGPTHPTNPGGLGEQISDRVVYTPWLTTTPVLPTLTPIIVKVYGPLSASAGETINLGVHAYNPFTETLHDAVVILTLPQQVDYGGSTRMMVVVPELARPSNDNPGERWPQKNQVVWKLGEFAPGQSFDAYTHATYRWGLPAHLMTQVSVRLVARNFPDPAVNLDTYWNYVPTTITDQHTLSSSQISATLFTDPELLGLYQDALAQGFKFYGTAYTQTLSTGTSSLDLVLIDPQRPSEVVLVRRVNDRRFVLHTTPTTLSAYNRTGGWSRSLETGAWSYWGEWNASNAPMLNNVVQKPCGPNEICTNPTWGQCFRNCLLGNLPNWLLGKYLSWFGDAQSAQACADCAAYGGNSECAACAAAIAEKALDVEGISVGVDTYNCAADCNDPAKKGDYVCSGDKVECGQFGLYGAMGINTRRRYTCDKYHCIFLWGYEDSPCAMGESCDDCCLRTGDCTPPPPGLDIEIRTAHDPNALYGPNRAAPGELLTYTVEYENLGEGTAYGVYVIDQLPAYLDRTSLQINSNGALLANPDRIVWPIGTVISHTGGSLSFSARVATNTLSGTLVINRATVYFPSVPETTPTNDIVTLIETVSAHTQQIETRGGVPVTFTLSSSSGSAQPLTYHVIETPTNGALSGLAPTFTYTPALSFVGLDQLSFTVSDGVNTSSPAEVIITVQPGNDLTPLKVIATEPISRAQKVPVYLTPGTIGGPYLPTIWLQFSKPISATTLTTQTLYVIDQSGHRLNGLVVYDAAQRAARFAPLEPLRRMQTYTATVTSGVKDAIGQALTTNYTWRFQTEYFSLYLPVTLKK